MNNRQAGNWPGLFDRFDNVESVEIRQIRDRRDGEELVWQRKKCFAGDEERESFSYANSARAYDPEALQSVYSMTFSNVRVPWQNFDGFRREIIQLVERTDVMKAIDVKPDYINEKIKIKVCRVVRPEEVGSPSDGFFSAFVRMTLDGIVAQCKEKWESAAPEEGPSPPVCENEAGQHAQKRVRFMPTQSCVVPQ